MKSKIKVPCPECGKLISPQGMGGHLWAKHKMKIQHVVKTKMGDGAFIEHETRNSDYLSKNKEIIETQTLKVDIEEKIECIRPDGKHFYTQEDLHILIGKIYWASHEFWNGSCDNPLFAHFTLTENVNQIKRDFERRFQCKFSEAVKANKEFFDQFNTEKGSAELKYKYMNYHNKPYSR